MLPSRMLFDSFLEDSDFSPSGFRNMMKMDIYEEDNKYIIEVDVPGSKKEDIKMDITNGYLTILAERRFNDKREDGRKYLHRERKYHEKCERQVYVGNVKEEDVKAEFKDGTLFVTVPKEDSTKKYIDIK